MQYRVYSQPQATYFKMYLFSSSRNIYKKKS